MVMLPSSTTDTLRMMSASGSLDFSAATSPGESDSGAAPDPTPTLEIKLASSEPIREVWIHDEEFAASRLSMMRIIGVAARPETRHEPSDQIVVGVQARRGTDDARCRETELLEQIIDGRSYVMGFDDRS
jgi:hypothetical protein